jgi:hypothetical protein
LFDKETAQQAPKAPDISAITNAMGAAAKASTAHAEENLNWAKDQSTKNTGTTDHVVGNALDQQHKLSENSAADRDVYENSMYPALQKQREDAATYATKEKKDADIGAAQSGVAQQFDAARHNATQQLESYGVNPASTRFAALDIGTRLGQAAASAAAGTKAGNDVDATARQLNQAVITNSAPLAAQSTNESNSANAAGTGAVNNATANTASGASTMGTGAQWAGLANTANAAQAGAINQNYQSQVDATKANNASADQNNKTSSGVGSALGMAAGMFLAEGGAVDPNEATPGGAVPAHASPTGGRAVDDVNANLTVGEFVMPKDVVAWKGQQFFHKEIEKARKAAQQVTAKPTIGPAVGGPKTFASRPQGAVAA